MANKKNNDSLVYGILSLVFGVLGFIILAIVFDPLGIIFGCIGLNKNSHDLLSRIGVALSIFGLILFVSYLLI